MLDFRWMAMIKSTKCTKTFTKNSAFKCYYTHKLYKLYKLININYIMVIYSIINN